MNVCRAVVRSWLMLLIGVVSVLATLLFHSWSGGGFNSVVFSFLKVSTGIVAAGALYASLFDTRRDRFFIAGLGVILASLVLFSSYGYWKPAPPGDRAIYERVDAHVASTGTTAPDFVLTDLSRETFRLEELRPSFVLLDFWGVEGPGLDDRLALRRLAHAEFEDEGLVVIGVVPGDSDEARERGEAAGVPFRLVGDDGTLADAFYVSSDWGGSVLMGPDGEILEVNLHGLDGIHRMARAIRGLDWNPAEDPVPRVR